MKLIKIQKFLKFKQYDVYEDVYEEFFKYRHLSDFSESINFFFVPTNKKVTGKMKDEFKWIRVNKFIRLKSKMVCFGWW